MSEKIYFDLGDGHELMVEKANRGLDDDYKVTFCEDGRKIYTDYFNSEAIEFEFGVELN